MWRSISALFTVIVAAVLSLTLAVPANAAEADWSRKPIPKNAIYKHGVPYYKQELRGGLWENQTINKLLNPGSDLPANTSNKPLTGKIIQPGKTPVMPPSVMKPTIPLSPGIAGASRWLGMAVVGPGGSLPIPSNAAEIYKTKGVTATCADAFAGGSADASCTATDYKTMMGVNSCSINAPATNCDAIGAKGADGQPLSNMFKMEVLPFLKDLWAKITGQSNEDTPLPGPVNSGPLGCWRSVNFVPTGPHTGTLAVTGNENVKARPTAPASAGTMWDIHCVQYVNDVAYGYIETTCIDTAGKTTSANGTNYGIYGDVKNYYNNDGTMKGSALCLGGGDVALFAVRLFIPWSDAKIAQDQRYSLNKPGEWVNPNPEAHTIGGHNAETTVNCKSPDGQLFTYTTTVKATAAFAAPACPAGSQMQDYKVDSKTDGGQPRSLGGGVMDPQAPANYPGCMTKDCALEVHIDGVPCEVGQANCETWPAVHAKTPSKVDCMWGGYEVPISNCQNLLSDGYKTETGVVFDPNSGTWTAVDAYGTPVASNPQPWNPTNPTPTPGVSPGTGTGTTPGTGTGTFPESGTNPENNCNAMTWSWNPINWVKDPVVCAMTEAFEPQADVKARLGSTVGTIQTMPPFSWYNAAVTGPGAAACPDWRIELPGVSKNVVCESSFTHAIVGSRGAMFGLISAVMVWPLLRSLWYAAIPFIRVTPSS